MNDPEIKLNIETNKIIAEHRKLKAVWRMEADQDLRAMLYSLSGDTIRRILGVVDDEIVGSLVRAKRITEESIWEDM